MINKPKNENPVNELKYVNKLLKNQKNDKSLSLKKLRLLSELEKFDEAEKLAKTFLEKNPDNLDVLYELGIVQGKHGKPEKALSTYERATTLNPKIVNNWLGKTVALIELGRLHEALDANTISLHIDSKDSFAHYLNAEILHILERFDEALKSINRALKIDSSNPIYWNQQAETLNAKSSYNLALDSIKKGLKVDPKDDLLWHTQGEIFENVNDFKSAKKSFENYYKFSNDSHAFSHLGNGARKLNKFNEALGYFNKGLKKNPKSWSLLLGKGSLLSEIGNHKQAIEILKKAYEIEDNPSILFELTDALIRNKNFVEALEYVEKRFVMDPTNKDIITAKSNVLASFGSYDVALLYIETLLKDDPFSADLLNKKGKLLRQLGKHNESIQILKLALKQDKNNLPLLHNLLQELSITKKYKEAFKIISQILKIQPNNTHYQYHKGVILTDGLNKPLEGIKCFQKILKQDPKDHRSMHSIATSLFQLKKFKECLVWINKSLKLVPNNSNGLFLKSDCLFELQKYDESLQVIEKAIMIKPKNSNYLVMKALNLAVLDDEKLALEFLKLGYIYDPKILNNFEKGIFKKYGIWKEFLKYKKSIPLEKNHE